jgi:hypothetical protein
MDTDLKLQYLPERIRIRRAHEARLAAAGNVVAEILDEATARGEEPSSREIADAIVRWLRTGVRGQ